MDLEEDGFDDLLLVQKRSGPTLWRETYANETTGLVTRKWAKTELSISNAQLFVALKILNNSVRHGPCCQLNDG